MSGRLKDAPNERSLHAGADERRPDRDNAVRLDPLVQSEARASQQVRTACPRQPTHLAFVAVRGEPALERGHGGEGLHLGHVDLPHVFSGRAVSTLRARFVQELILLFCPAQHYSRARMLVSALRAAPLLAALIVVGDARTAVAAETLSEDAAKVAREHHRAGVTHYDLAEYGAALEEFKAAYRAVQDPSLLFNIAQCHRKIGQRADAISFYRSYLRRSPEGANHVEAEHHIGELEREIAAASARGAPASVPPSKPVPPADVVVPASMPPSAGTAGPASGATRADARPPIPSAGASKRRVGAFVFGGAGLLAIGIGSAVALSARSTYNGTIGRCPGMVCTTLDDKNTIDGARSRGDVATVLWIGGLAALATGTVLWVTEPRRSGDLTARPMFGPGVGGMVIAGALP